MINISKLNDEEIAKALPAPVAVEQTPIPNKPMAPLITQNTKKRLTKQLSLQRSPRLSVVPGKLHTLDEGVTAKELL